MSVGILRGEAQDDIDVGKAAVVFRHGVAYPRPLVVGVGALRVEANRLGEVRDRLDGITGTVIAEAAIDEGPCVVRAWLRNRLDHPGAGRDDAVRVGLRPAIVPVAGACLARERQSEHEKRDAEAWSGRRDQRGYSSTFLRPR